MLLGTHMGMKFVGARIRRREDAALLCGAGCFTDDLRLDGTLVATFVRSEFAHARIASIDLTAARAMPGVVGIWTAADLPQPLRGKTLPIWVPTHTMAQARGFPPLARDEATYVGEPIAVVVAESRYLGEDAVDAIAINYEPLPAVVDCRAAAAPSSPTAHAQAKDNIAARFTVEYGDVDAAFANAQVIVRAEFRLHRGLCQAMEGRAVLAWFDASTNKLTLWSAGQTPHFIKRMLVETLELDDEHVRVITPNV
ncbi:MAG: molybdopterin cofactor-binding domain-containing protein, partial [Xanthobacteraceae bacterium]